VSGIVPHFCVAAPLPRGICAVRVSIAFWKLGLRITRFLAASSWGIGEMQERKTGSSNNCKIVYCI